MNRTTRASDLPSWVRGQGCQALDLAGCASGLAGWPSGLAGWPRGGGQTVRKSPHSTGLCPLSKPLPRYSPTLTRKLYKAGQGYR